MLVAYTLYTVLWKMALADIAEPLRSLLHVGLERDPLSYRYLLADNVVVLIWERIAVPSRLRV